VTLGNSIAFRLFFAYADFMPDGLEVGGYEQRPDWPKVGPSLLIATCLILAIRTAKWPAVFDKHTAHPELDREIDFAEHLAGRVLSTLVSKRESIFPQKREPWYRSRYSPLTSNLLRRSTANITRALPSLDGRLTAIYFPACVVA
jgi:hypothetical protein